MNRKLVTPIFVLSALTACGGESDPIVDLVDGMTQEMSFGVGAGMTAECFPETEDRLAAFLLKESLLNLEGDSSFGSELTQVYEGLDIGRDAITSGDVTCEQLVEFTDGVNQQIRNDSILLEP